MAYILNPKTQKYDIHIIIPSSGIKKPQKKLIESFETEIEAKAAAIAAKKTLEIIPHRIPTNEEINRWIASKMSYPSL